MPFVTIIGALLLVISLIGGDVVLSHHAATLSTPKAEVILPTSAPTPSPIYIQKEVFIPPTSTPTSDPDPLVGCQIQPKCGGEVQQLKSSECSSIICCQIGNNWSIYPSSDSCAQAQNSQYEGIYTPTQFNLTIPNNTTTPYSLPPLPTDAPLPTIDNSSNQQALQACLSSATTNFNNQVQMDKNMGDTGTVGQLINEANNTYQIAKLNCHATFGY